MPSKYLNLGSESVDFFDSHLHNRSMSLTQRLLKTFFFGILCLALQNIAEAAKSRRKSVQFRPVAHATDAITPMDKQKKFGIGLIVQSHYPLSESFTTLNNTSNQRESLDQQSPVGVGLELSYAFTKNLELALGLAFENFESRLLVDEPPAATTKVYDVIRYRFFPVTAHLRYRWPKKYWAPEVELGIGNSFGSLKARNSAANSIEQSIDSGFLRAHGALGVAFSWAENFSLHFQMGYSYQKLGNDDFANPLNIEKTDSFEGVFAKAMMKSYFF